MSINKNNLHEYLGSYAVTQPVNVDVVIEAAENGVLLSAPPYVKNAMHWHQGDDVFLRCMEAVFL